jgi:hypothetical protein
MNLFLNVSRIPTSISSVTGESGAMVLAWHQHREEADVSRFKDELKVIPDTARVIAMLAFIAATTGVACFVWMGHDPGVARTPVAVRFLIMVVAGVIPTIYVLLIGYVFADAKRRGMHYVMWTLLVIFLPESAIGFILYFILRDPLPATCPACGTSVRSKFVFCPSCGTSVKPTCSHCGKAVNVAWTHCAHCGSTLPGRLPRTT